MAHNEDERLWAPDAEVTFEYREPNPFASEQHEDAPALSGWSKMRRWRGLSFVAVCVVVAFVVVVTIASDDASEPTDATTAQPDSGAGSEQPEFETLPTPDAVDSGGDVDVVLGLDDPPLLFAPARCLRHRLPRSIDRRWMTDLPSDHGTGGQESIGDEVVVLPIRRSSSNDAPATAELLALDLVDGSERWRVGLGSAAGPPEIVDVFAGVAVVWTRDELSGRTVLVGISERSGDEMWRNVMDHDVDVIADAASGMLIVYDTDVDGPLDDDAQHDVTWFDPTTFMSTNQVVGRFLGLSENGSVTVVRDGVVSVVHPRTGIVVEASWPDDRDPSRFAVVGSGLVVGEGASLELNEMNPSGGWRQRALDLNGSVGIVPPTQITSLAAIGESSVVVGSQGAVHGGDVTPDSIDLRWRRSGTAIGGEASDRGGMLLLRRDGVAVTDIIDASTGRTIVEVPRPPVVALYANGALVGSFPEPDEPAVRTAYDLDGLELWALSDTSATVVGDRVVVAIGFAGDLATDGSRPPLRVTAYGELPNEPAVCDRVVSD